MRQVLIDHSRHRGDHVKVQPAALAELLPRAVWSQPVTDESIAVRALLARLRKTASLAAESISLRYIEGLTIDEVGRRQGRDPWSIRTDCIFGLKWMADRLSFQPAPK